MLYETSVTAIAIFAAFVLGVIGLSFWLGRKGQTAQGYYAAHGEIHWFVNGIAFAGDYLSAASFLGICGMIAFHGYDGFLYSIGFLAGWVVALFVIAEPIKELGKFTFADALDARFDSWGIKLAVAISTLVVSVFYLIPQMVGAGSLVTPLLGLPHWVGVILVGVAVTCIVVTAGMVSTTWVQFIKGSLLVLFCGVLTGLILARGLAVNAGREGPVEMTPQVRTIRPDGTVLVDGKPQGTDHDLRPVGTITRLPDRYGDARATGPLGPLAYLAALEASGIADAKQRERIAKFYGMIENIDTNMGRLLAKLDAWGLAEYTLVVFTTDNGTASGAAVCNDGMRGHKGSPWRGGTRVPAFWRWPGTLPAGVDVPAVVAHIDVLPTLCEITATAIPAGVAAKVEGRSLVPLLHDATAAWPDRPLVTHVGRWDRGKAAESALRNCRIREGRWSLVNVKNDPHAWELYDLATDPGETRDVAADHADVVARLAGQYGQWWDSVQGDLVNEDQDGPAENPFKTAFRDQQAGKGRRDE